MPHTPGPWRIGDAGHTVFGPPNGNPSPKTIAHNLSRGDARLIAAAPALLSALEEIVFQACVNGCPDFENPKTGNLTTRHTRACKTARAALALARGEDTR